MLAQHIHRQKQGFSLIELLVAIVIISALAALLLPTLEKSLKECRRAACANNLHQISTGISLYCNDYGDSMPVQDLVSFTYRFYECKYTLGGAAGALGLGHLYYKGYIPSLYAFLCPEHKSAASSNSFSYMYNPYGGWEVYNTHIFYFSAVHPAFKKLEQFPARRPVTIDRTTVFNSGNSPYKWHDGRWNRQFADGSVDSFSSSDAVANLVLYDPLGQWVNGAGRAFSYITQKSRFSSSSFLHGENPCFCGR